MTVIATTPTSSRRKSAGLAALVLGEKMEEPIVRWVARGNLNCNQHLSSSKAKRSNASLSHHLESGTHCRYCETLHIGNAYIALEMCPEKKKGRRKGERKREMEYKIGVVYTPVKRGFSRRLSSMLLLEPLVETLLLSPEVPDGGTFGVLGWL